MYLKPWLVVLMLSMFVGGIGSMILRQERSYVDVGLAIFPVFFFISMRRFIRRVVDQHPEFLEEQTLRFDTSGLSITNSVVTVQWPWSRVHSVSDATDFLLLRFDTLGSGAIIPKRALTDGQRTAFLGYAAGKEARAGDR